MSIECTYDDANRILAIDHRNAIGMTMLKLSYWYDARNLPIWIFETSAGVPTADSGFEYDDRGRLIKEWRSGAPASHHFQYKYDQGGNRTEKIDPINQLKVVYEYDTTDGVAYPSFNNRLMKYETYDTSGGEEALLSTTYYYYNRYGNVTRIVTGAGGTDHYTSTWLEYAKNDVAVTFISGEQWDWNGQAGYPVTNYQVDYVREFWYDGPRQRYANRLIDLDKLLDHGLIEPVTVTWSDYDGETIYGDYTIDYDPTVLTSTVAYEPGIAKTLDPLGTPEALYYHADHLGTTRGMSDESVAWVQESAYSAFGELTGGTNHRYGYVGTDGYQAHDEFAFLHLGARYYDPASGRFLQRDPIGISGGLNVYEYMGGNPVFQVDPNGLRAINDDWGPLPGVPVDKGEREGVQRGAAIACAVMAVVATGYYGWRFIQWLRPKPTPKPTPRPKPYPVGPEPDIGPDVPRPIYPGEDHVVPSKPPNLPEGPPEYDPHEPWPS